MVVDSLVSSIMKQKLSKKNFLGDLFSALCTSVESIKFVSYLFPNTLSYHASLASCLSLVYNQNVLRNGIVSSLILANSH